MLPDSSHAFLFAQASGYMGNVADLINLLAQAKVRIAELEAEVAALKQPAQEGLAEASILPSEPNMPMAAAG